MSLSGKRVYMKNEKLERIRPNSFLSNRYLYMQIVLEATEYKLMQKEKNNFPILNL